ncbi:MAG: endonuclease/exonuclease/phosphatase family protein [Lentisphaeria bacterium]|nr:endonuclease/exonuclease/phosphatase family protein [Candidatus Neomarinimicrobiota bacterium]MCF7843040.1 endonuclease/exonuclease/phosphatase family protein [Lentisphaeria bacterium]
MIRNIFSRSFRDPSRRWKHIINLLIFALLAFLFLPNPFKSTSELRVMTYNIRHGLGLDRVLKLERIAAVINDFEPDIVVLNEVDMGTARSNGVRDTDRLAELTGLHGYFGRSIDFDGGEYGNGLLSRWPIAGRLQVWDISNALSNEGRSVFRAVIPTTDDTLQVLGTHLGLDENERTLQARFIDSLLVIYAHRYPTILAGDFNFEVTSQGYEIITRRLPDTYAFMGLDSIRTYPVPTPERRIDYIFASLNWSGLQAVHPQIAVVDTASDHYPLQLVLVP